MVEFDGENNATVYKHTLPSFIPVSAELGPLLGKSLKRFIATTTLYLNAYVARRQQVLAVQKQYVCAMRVYTVYGCRERLLWR